MPTPSKLSPGALSLGKPHPSLVAFCLEACYLSTLYFVLWLSPCLPAPLGSEPEGRASILHACVHAKSLQLCPTLCDPMDSSPPGSSVHSILQARLLEWVAMPSSRGIFLTQRPNPRLLHWQAGSLPLVPGSYKCQERAQYAKILHHGAQFPRLPPRPRARH